MENHGRDRSLGETLAKRWDQYFFKRFNLKDAILLGFFATLIVVTRAGLRLHLKIPGHSMFFMCFFLVLAAGCVPRMWAATVTGFVAGIVAILLGMGHGGPIMLLRFLLPALVVDGARLVFPRLTLSFVACAVVGVLASASRFLIIILPDVLAGMDWHVFVQHGLMTTAMGMGFGGLGAAMAPAIIRRLQTHGLIVGE